MDGCRDRKRLPCLPGGGVAVCVPTVRRSRFRIITSAVRGAGPWHVTVVPSPIDHDTDFGVAVAVTDTPGTDAVADAGAHLLASHSQVGKFTS